MSESQETLAARIDERFGEQMRRVPSICGELTYELDKEDLAEIATALRNEADFGFEMLMDVCGIDYLSYGTDEWLTNEATGTGFSRGVARQPVILDEADEFDPKRFAVVYHLLSLHHNQRLRLRVYTGQDHPPRIRSFSSAIGMRASFAEAQVPITISSVARRKYSSASRLFTMIWPVPGVRNTRALASLRRPVAYHRCACASVIVVPA